MMEDYKGAAVHTVRPVAGDAKLRAMSTPAYSICTQTTVSAKIEPIADHIIALIDPCRLSGYAAPHRAGG